MALMDEWAAPEPTPYFLTRLQAHLREEQARPQGWFAFLRRPAMAVSLAVVLVVGGASIPLIRSVLNSGGGQPATGAVSDLESLGKNHDLLVSTDLLDELSGGPSDDVSDPEL
jgi:NAD/NADP transhydrogenase beta subunit